jgi:hypothetical protein
MVGEIASAYILGRMSTIVIVSGIVTIIIHIAGHVVDVACRRFRACFRRG